jgi:SP family arabinose:H+ symporter-like MFS transporter
MDLLELNIESSNNCNSNGILNSNENEANTTVSTNSNNLNNQNNTYPNKTNNNFFFNSNSTRTNLLTTPAVKDEPQQQYLNSDNGLSSGIIEFKNKNKFYQEKNRLLDDSDIENQNKRDFKEKYSTTNTNINTITNTEVITVTKPDEPVSKIIDEIGLNNYQLRIILFGIFIAFSYGSEIVVISLITRKLEKIWHLSDLKKASLGGSLFYGYLFSSLISGMIMNVKGRKFCFSTGSWVFLFFGLLSSMSDEFYSFMFYRIGVGFGLGLMIPSTMTFISEMSPSKWRGFCMNIIWIGFPLGELFICLIAKCFPLDNKFSQDSNWTNVIFFASIPIMVNLVVLNYLHESPKLMFMKRQFDEGFEVMSKIIKIENDGAELTEKDKSEIFNYYASKGKGEEEGHKHVIDLFAKKDFMLSMKMLVLTFVISYVFFALLYIIPELVGKTAEYVNFHDLLRTIVYATVFEFIGLLASFIQEINSVGRIGAFKISMFICLISSFFCLINDKNQMSLFVLKGVVGVANRVNFTYFPESYSTDLRGEALGLTHSLTKIIGITCPIICQFFLSYSVFSCFVVLSVLCLVGFMVTLTLSKETLNEKLD